MDARAIVTGQAIRSSQAMSQVLAGSGSLGAARPGGHGGYAPGRLDDAVRRLKNTSAPLLQALDPETLLAVRGGQPD